jgi:2'-5' RNA ligase
VDLDERFMAGVAAWAESLRGQRRLAKARWVVDQAHLTLRFIGLTDPSQVPSLVVLVQTLAARSSFEVRASSLLAFPEPKRARVLGVALSEETGTLASLAAEAERAAVAMGWAPDPRADDFRPHITLARMKEPADVRTIVASHAESLVGRATGITLFESVLHREGAEYKPLARATLSACASRGG